MKTLRSKFIFWICLLFVLIGILIFVPLSIILPEKITSLILQRDIRIAQYLSREVQEPLLLNNRLGLRLLLEDRLENFEDAVYIFIRSRDGAIVESTFRKGFPRGLLSINNPGEVSYSIKEFSSAGKKAYDIAIPVLKGELGSLHIGVSLESSKPEIAEFSAINYYLALVIFIGLGIGILIFTSLSIFLSNRIIKLKDFAARIGGGNLKDRIEIKTNDEIGVLATAFNEMASRLREKIEEINKLNILKERDRIALDLHDGCAQELATIIKGLELCEKLFQIDPARASQELGYLKEGVRCILGKTRQTIFDLKLPEDMNFDLLEHVNSYITAYRKQNDINVKIGIIGRMEALSSDRAKQIFYIIGEALANASKHSLAKNIELRLEASDNNELILDINDDGNGFDMNTTGSSVSNCGKWGFISMRQRAASLGGILVIKSAPREGTRLHANIPLKERKV